MEDVISLLSPIEKKVIPFLSLPFEQIIEKSGLDNVSVFRALKYLANKKIIELSIKKAKVVELGTNGIMYSKNNLPERTLLDLLANRNIIRMEEAQKESRLSENEFRAALGMLKGKLMVEIKDGKIKLIASKEEIVKKTLEEQLLEKLKRSNLYLDALSSEQKSAFESLIKRKDIIKIKEDKKISFNITNLGKTLMKSISKKPDEELIESLTPDILKSGAWLKKKFRHYDIKSSVPKIFGGRKHFVNQAIDYAKKIWVEMGFKEMKGPAITTSFWNFDALFTPQDHPARDLHDTYFISAKGKIDPKISKAVKQAHETGVNSSKGWQYQWSEEEAKKLVLRTHTTAISAMKLAELNKTNSNALWNGPAKYFAIGRCYRNETLDWKHSFEFNQTEGIVIDENANFSHLLGYLKEFFAKMGFSQIRFRPHYFPYTEPSVEIDVFHPEKKEWIELGGAGIFRPEVTIPLIGKDIPVLAWGPGFDRMILDYYEIKDIRDLYKNDIKQLREIKYWLKWQ